MYSLDRIKECYYQLMQMRAEKQKMSIDKKANSYKQELDIKAYELKKRVQEDAIRQMNLIDSNTANYKLQIDLKAEKHKKIIDDNVRNKIESQTLTLEDVQEILRLLNK